MRKDIRFRPDSKPACLKNGEKGVASTVAMAVLSASLILGTESIETTRHAVDIAVVPNNVKPVSAFSPVNFSNSVKPLAAGIHVPPPPPPPDPENNGNGNCESSAGIIAHLRYAPSFRFRALNHIPADFNRMPWKEIPIVGLPDYPGKNVEHLMETFKETLEKTNEEDRWKFLEIPGIRDILKKVFNELQI